MRAIFTFAATFIFGNLRGKFARVAGVALLCAAPSVAQIQFLGAQSTVPTTGLSHPFGAAVDSSGNVYVADKGNNRVVKITPAGTQTTVITDPLTLTSPVSVAVDQSGNLFISDRGNNRIVKRPAGNGAATAFAAVTTPGGLAVDGSGNVFVADSSQHKIVKITSAGVVSDFETGLGTPVAVAVDTSGNVYLADSSLTTIVKYPPGGGAGTNVVPPSSFVEINGVAVDNAGNVYVVESGEVTAIIEVTAAGPQFTLPVSGMGTADYLAVDANYNLFIPDDTNNAVIEFSTKTVNLGFANVCQGNAPSPCSRTATLNFEPVDDTITTVSTVTLGDGKGEFGKGDNSCTDSSVACTVEVTFTAQAPGMQPGAVVLGDGNLEQDVTFPVYGVGNAAEAAFDPAETSPPFGTDGFVDPVALAVGGGGVLNGPIYIADDEACRIFVLDFEAEEILPFAGGASCDFSGDGAAANMAELNSPEDVAVDGAGNVYIADEGNNVVRRVDVNGNIATVAGQGTQPSGFSGDGGPATSAKLDQPFGIALDGAGNLYIADTTNNRIRKVDLGGIITTVAGNGTGGYSGDAGPATSAELFEPYGVRVDAAGNLFIADSGNNVIRKVDTTGKITTVAGNFEAGEGESGDGGPATSAQLAFPLYVSVDAAGELFIADGDSGVVRIVNASGKISTYNAPTDVPEDLVVDLAGNFAMIDPQDEAVTLVARFFSQGLTFGTQNVNTTSAAQDVTVTDIGNQTLDVVDITSPAGFNLNGADTSCEADSTLAVGASCILGIEFAPTTATEYSDSVGLTDNSLGPDGVLQPIDVSGTGVIPLTPTTTTLTASPNPAFEGQTVTLTATVTPKPTGGALGTVTFCLGKGGPGVVLGKRVTPSQAFGRWKAGAAVTPDVSSCGPDFSLGTANVAADGTATLTTTKLDVGANSIYAVYNGNPTLATSTSDPVTVTINALTVTTTTLTISPSPGADGQTITLTGTVAPAPTGSPLGTVTFCDSSGGMAIVRHPNTSGRSGRRPRPSAGVRPQGPAGPCGADTPLGTSNVNASGVATLAITTLTVGDHDIYAVYSGNVGFAGSTSDPVTETINTAYTVTAPQTPFDVAEGGSVQITITVPPLGGAYNNVVTLVATGLPKGATATFVPPTVTPGANGATSVMTIQLAPIMARHLAPPPARPSWPVAPIVGVAGLLLLAAGFRRRPLSRALAALLLAAGISATALALAGCDGGFAGLSTPRGQYTVTVTGTSGSLSASTTVTVVVQ